MIHFQLIWLLFSNSVLETITSSRSRVCCQSNRRTSDNTPTQLGDAHHASGSQPIAPPAPRLAASRAHCNPNEAR